MFCLHFIHLAWKLPLGISRADMHFIPLAADDVMHVCIIASLWRHKRGHPTDDVMQRLACSTIGNGLRWRRTSVIQTSGGGVLLRRSSWTQDMLTPVLLPFKSAQNPARESVLGCDLARCVVIKSNSFLVGLFKYKVVRTVVDAALI